MASQLPPKKNAVFTLYFTLYKNDGTVIANPGIFIKKISIDGNATADLANSVVKRDTNYGLCSILLSVAEMSGDSIWIYIVDDTAGCVPFTCTILTSAYTLDQIKSETAAILEDTGTTLPGALSTIAGYVDTEIAALIADMAKIPKSDGSVSLNATVLAAIQNGLATATELAAAKAVIDNLHDTDLPEVKADGAEILTRLPDEAAGATGGLSLVGSAMTLTTGTLTGIAAAVWDALTSGFTTVGSIGSKLAAWLTSITPGSTAYGATDLVLCNNALMMLGNEPLVNLNDTTKKAVRLCAQFYQQAVDEALRAYTWNCAMTRVAVTADATPPAFGYAYRYALPADCLRVIGLKDKTDIYKIESGYILTDEPTCNLIYINRISAEYMDVLLRKTVSARLASLIAFPLTNSTSLAEAMFKLYKDCVQEAETVDAFEGASEQLFNDDWINSRR